MYICIGSDDEKYSIQWYTMKFTVDFMVKSAGFHGKDFYNVYLYWFR